MNITLDKFLRMTAYSPCVGTSVSTFFLSAATSSSWKANNNTVQLTLKFNSDFCHCFLAYAVSFIHAQFIFQVKKQNNACKKVMKNCFVYKYEFSFILSFSTSYLCFSFFHYSFTQQSVKIIFSKYEKKDH